MFLPFIYDEGVRIGIPGGFFNLDMAPEEESGSLLKKDR